MTHMIQATGLVKTYKEVNALDGLDLCVPQGSVLGLLGPNGAGKTTAVRILTTLLKANSGQATVAGFDVLKQPDEVRKNIGLSGQFAAVDEYLTGFENLRMVARLYGMNVRDASARARELLERFGLNDAADRPSKTYSGGMRRRLDLAGALVANPPVLVLDEPTTGLDPGSRQQMWDVIEGLVANGTTLLLTTQYLEEADLLADNIIVINHGRAIAEGTADQLKSRTGGQRIDVLTEHLEDTARTAALVDQVSLGSVKVKGRSVSAAISGDGASHLVRVGQSLIDAGIPVLDLGLRRPTLDDVFLALTGRDTTDASTEDEA